MHRVKLAFAVAGAAALLLGLVAMAGAAAQRPGIPTAFAAGTPGASPTAVKQVDQVISQLRTDLANTPNPFSLSRQSSGTAGTGSERGTPERERGERGYYRGTRGAGRTEGRFAGNGDQE